MIDFIKRFLTRNLLLKVCSLFAALVLWVIVVNNQDPMTTTTITGVPIEIINEDYFIQRDQYVTVESPLKLNVTIGGQRSVIENMEADDLTATIDYLSVEPSEGKALISVTVNNRRVTVERQSISYVKLNVQNMVSLELPIELKIEGTPEEGYLLQKDSPETVFEPSSVIVKGPSSVLEQLDRAEVVVNAAGADDNISGKGKTIQFYDAEGALVDLDELEAVTSSARMMSQLVIPVYANRTVPVMQPEVRLDEDSEYYVNKVSISVDQLTLYGPKNALDQIRAVELARINITDPQASSTRNYPVSSICQDLALDYFSVIGAVEGSPETISVTVELSPKKVKNFTLKSGYVLIGRADKINYDVRMDPLTVQVMGRPEDVDKISVKDIVVSIDVSSCEENGTYELPYTIGLPEGVVLKEAVEGTVIVEVSDGERE